MSAWVSCTGAELCTRDPAEIVGRLAAAQAEAGLSATAAAGGAAWARGRLEKPLVLTAAC